MPAFVDFSDVSFAYPGRGQVVADLDLTLGEGELFVLIGPSGCGKTTVLNLLAGFEQPTAGEVRVDGRRVEHPDVDRTVVFQDDDSLLPWLTASENVEFGLRATGVPARARRERAAEQLARLGLADDRDKFPRELSGGMRQRVQIARAMVGSGRVLIMDEPFGKLDAQTRMELQQQLVALWQDTGRTILFVTHDIDEAVLLGDRVGVMGVRPIGHLAEVLPVTLPRPRRRDDPAFGHMHGRVSAALAAGWRGGERWAGVVQPSVPRS